MAASRSRTTSASLFSASRLAPCTAIHFCRRFPVPGSWPMSTTTGQERSPRFRRWPLIDLIQPAPKHQPEPESQRLLWISASVGFTDHLIHCPTFRLNLSGVSRNLRHQLLLWQGFPDAFQDWIFPPSSRGQPRCIFLFWDCRCSAKMS